MTPSLPTPRLLLYTVLGALFCLASTILASPHANAAVSDMTFELGTISRGLSGTGAHWDPTRGGTFSASYSGFKLLGGAVLATGTATGALGKVKAQARLGGISFLQPAKAFSNAYNFSLHKASNLSVKMYSGRYAAELGLIGAATAFVGNQLTVTLATRDGRIVDRQIIRGGAWTNVWSNLVAGDYTMTIGGKYGFNDPKLLGAFEQAYAGVFSVSDGNGGGGDVPLPGALALLGTALVGTGFYGRLKKSRRKDV